MYYRPLSSKPFALDFMQEIFEMFVREIVTEMEREKLEENYPEYKMLVKEYYDGIMLFELSNKRIWNKPADMQAQAETEWIKELNEKYPVKINKKVLKNIKKYIK